MADLNKFEQMLEKLVNEDKAGAEELFHEIVVEKSRDIYESLLESDLEDDDDEGEVGDATGGKRTGVKGPKQAAQDPKEGGKTKAVKEDEDEEVDESDDDAELDEDFNLDEFEVEADPMDAMMGDMQLPAADDEAEKDDAERDMADDDGEEGDMEDRVEDLEDALEELKAEFEAMMAGDDDMDMDMDMGDEEGEEDEGEEEPEEESFNFEAAEEEVEESKTPKTAGEQMREYVEKVTAKMGDNGVNNKSTVAGKNPLGNTGTTANIAKGGVSKGEGTKGGLAAPTAKEDNAGNVNVPGAKGATKTASQPCHGDEKKGKPEQAANTKPVIGK